MVLDSLGDSLKQAFRKIAGLGIVDRQAVDVIVRDIQRALLQADVDVSLVAELSGKIRKSVLESKPPAGLTLREYFIKILYEEIVRFLGAEGGEIQLKPQKILLIGLFGCGKTTTAGKLGRWFKVRGMSVGLVACDTHRPAAQEQLRQIGNNLDIKVYSEGKNPEEIAKKAISMAREDVLIFDSAGRDALDRELAKELENLGKIIDPQEVILVIPADIGQAARKQAEEFNRLVGITGIIVTKLDGTAKGGGALAASVASGARVKFIGVGEKPEDFEMYDPKRFVSRLIGYGDLQGLLEKARETGITEESAKKIVEGRFTLNDFIEQVSAMQKMGPLSKIAEMIPGISGLKIPKDMLDVEQEKMKKWVHIINSMTPAEREDPEIIKHSRIVRIARGAGVKEQDVREVLKYYKQVQKFMKIAKGGKGLKRGPLARMMRQMGLNLDME
ncbi:MAG: signal recognition particle receptor subunit alpha [Candidatus Aenigmatarchaeota archaeon]